MCDQQPRHWSLTHYMLQIRLKVDQLQILKVWLFNFAFAINHCLIAFSDRNAAQRTMSFSKLPHKWINYSATKKVIDYGRTKTLNTKKTPSFHSTVNDSWHVIHTSSISWPSIGKVIHWSQPCLTCNCTLFYFKYKFKTRRFCSLKLHTAVAENENQIKLKETQHTQALH